MNSASVAKIHGKEMIDLNGRRLILVTGSPRSGTTAVGHNLSLPISAGYLHEPFNVTVGIRDVTNEFEAVGAHNFSAERLDAIMSGIVTLRLRWKSGVWPRDRGVRRLMKHLIGGRARVSFLRCLTNPVLDTMERSARCTDRERRIGWLRHSRCRHGTSSRSGRGELCENEMAGTHQQYARNF